MKQRIAILCLLCTCCVAFAHAQPDPYSFSRLDINRGLSSNQVTCIFKDRQGFMWFGTMSGLNRYDGYHFKIFRHRLQDTTSLNDDYISNILEGPDNKLWIQTRNGFTIYDPATERFDRQADRFLNSIGITGGQPAGILKDTKNNFWFYNDSALFLYEPVTGKTTKFVHQPSDAFSIGTSIISAFREDTKGNFWILHRNGILEMMEGVSRKIFSRSSAVQSVYPKGEFYYRLFIDRDNDLWVYPANNPKGITLYQPQTGAIQVYNKDAGPAKLSTNIINGIAQDDDGLLWIATDHGGLNIIDKAKNTVQYLTYKEDDNKSLSQNSVTALYKDNTGTMWAGTFKKGLNSFHRSATRFPFYRRQSSDPNSLSYDDVNRFVEDAKGNLWIGTNGGGLVYFDRATGRFSTHTHNPANPSSLSNDVIIGLCIDHTGRLWIGTYFGGLDCFDGNRFIHYRHSDTDTGSLSDDRVWDIFEDSKQQLWVATLGGGVNIFNPASGTFSHIKASDAATIKSNFVFDFLEDRQGNIWMATALGIDVLQSGTGRFIHYQNSTGTPGSLSNNNVTSLFQDSRGTLWACTRDGLNAFDAKTKTFSVFRTENGLPDNTILNLEEDDAHRLWASTPSGLSVITVAQGGDADALKISCRNYDNSDGLQGREFNTNAAYRTSRGEMVFGGANGFNLFNPQSIVPGKTKPVLAFTDFELFNKPLGIGEKVDGHTVLPQSITQTKELNLRYNENIISIEFAALNFTNTDKIQYAYQLVGFNKDWIVTDGRQRRATYTNLDPGQYVFQVKAFGDNVSGNEPPITLLINIAPPFWKTTWAYILYSLLLVAALVLARRLVLQRAKRRFDLEQERQEARRMHEMDLMKIRFFTNVSHEFRTPISLILSPVEKMMQLSEEPGQRKQYQLIHRNARRLLNMVNQLLDFRKMEVKELKLAPSQGDIVRFIREISYSFTDLAENKHIHFSFNTTVEHIETLFDGDKLERILFNLLSNAFKFTRPDGFVSVEVDYKSGESTGGLLEIKVQDTGIGIEADKQEKIFERFFQNDIPGSMVNQGSGIGLAITKEFVKLHGGTLSVESEPGKGSCFTVWLPIVAVQEAVAEVPAAGKPEVVTGQNLLPQNGEPEAAVRPEKPVNEKASDPKKPLLLLVEDNEDFRFYLKDNLHTHFNIVEAANGKEGWQKALATHPVLVISDISMPEMNGIDLCKKVKADPRTRHLPVILLTALAGEEKMLHGLETGANDYMTKPFNFEVLMSRVKNILQQQDSLKKTLKKQVAVQTADINLPSPNEAFIQQAVAMVEKKMENPEFSVEDLSREMFMSRVGLYKKLLTLTGKTPIEFIRSIRLQRAAQLLEKSSMNITEVAYEVGFNQPRYFAKYFKQEFGMLPSAYLAEKKGESIKEG